MTQAYSNDRSRLTVAQEAARIMADHGISDFQVAKRKAAERLGLSGHGALPSNIEVVLSLMTTIEQFEPRLVGPLLAGTAAADAPANLHLFSDSAEDVAWLLQAEGTDYRPFERRLRVRRGQSASYPGYRFAWQRLVIEATVFPYDGLRQAPLSPVDGKPMRRASPKKLRKLLDEVI